MSQYDRTSGGTGTGSTGSSYGGGSSTSLGGGAGGDVNMAVVTPTDRVRWGPILAGLFAALSTLAVLGVLGAAIAGSAYDPGDSGRAFGIGAGIWGALSALLAFALGGWVAARSAAVRGHDNGLLNGAMVWAVAIPVMGYFLASGATRAAETGSNIANTAMQASSRMQSDQQSVASGDAQLASAQSPAGDGVSTGGSASATGGGSGGGAGGNMNDPQAQERAADAGARAAWGTLVALLLGLAASAVGGYLGARGTGDHSRRVATA